MYKFQTTKGSFFGVYDSPMLRRVLRKIVTPETCRLDTYKGHKVGLDNANIITLTYVGLLKKDVLSKDFGFELTSGAEGHAFNVAYSKGTIFDKYVAGTINWTKSPLPPVKKAVDNRSEFEKDQESYETMNMIGQENVAIENNTQAQLN